MLEKPEWKNDIWPEIMDGKNVFDYVDPDIIKKLERLEKEEENYYRSQDANMEDGNESSELDEDLLEAHEDVEKNKKIIRKKHELTKNSLLPRRVRGLTESEKFMQEIRSEKKEIYNNLSTLSKDQTNDRREKLRNKLKREARKHDSDDEFESGSEGENQMDIEGDDKKQHKKKKQLTEEEQFKNKQREANERQKTVTIQRMKNKLQKNWNRQARVNDADRQIGSKLPKHLNSGKRGIGKTDRR